MEGTVLTKYIYETTLANLTESAQKKSFAKIKAKLNQPEYILATKSFEPDSYIYQTELDIVSRVINMYDYFQGIVATPIKKLHVHSPELFDHRVLKIVSISPQQSDIYQNGQKIAEVNVASKTTQLVNTITWLNAMGEPASRDFYDSRGFKSSTQYFHLNGNLGHQVMFNLTGQPKMEIITMAIEEQEQVTGYKLLDYQGDDYLFANEAELWQFFQAELANNE